MDKLKFSYRMFWVTPSGVKGYPANVMFTLQGGEHSDGTRVEIWAWVGTKHWKPGLPAKERKPGSVDIAWEAHYPALPPEEERTDVKGRPVYRGSCGDPKEVERLLWAEGSDAVMAYLEKLGYEVFAGWPGKGSGDEAAG